MRTLNAIKKFLDAPTILRYLIMDDDKLNRLLIYSATPKNIYTTDAEVYKALASLQKYDTFNIKKLTKLFEAVDVHSHFERTGRKKGLLTHEAAAKIRKEALKVEQ